MRFNSCAGFSSAWWRLEPDFDYVHWLVLVGGHHPSLAIRIIELQAKTTKIYGFKGVKVKI